MHVGVEPTRITIGSEWLPRCASPTVGTLASGTHGCIEVATGTLTIPATFVGGITTLIVLPGATLDVTCGAQITGRNVPINTTLDPFQWGNGLVNFGTLRMVCPTKVPFAVLTGPAANGATSITVDRDVDWTVGDDLVLPDTRQMGGGVTPTREVGTKIASVNGRTFGLSKPLAFARNSITRPNGTAVLQPRVLNLTRRTVIRSENPAGVPWHIANIGGAASWDVQGVTLDKLGRTKPQALHSTSPDGTQIGNNQIGRYAFHMHHNGSTLDVRRVKGIAIIGHPGGKWGVFVHQTHDTEITDSVCVDVPGSCFGTEDGNEVRNVFRNLMAAYEAGSGVGSTDARSNVSNNNPGVESCYWFRGVHNIFDDLEAWNCQSSINLFNQFHVANGVAVPSVKGGTPDTVYVLQELVPISMKRPVTAANTDSGLEFWTVRAFDVTHLISAHNALKQVWNGQADNQSDIRLVDPILIAGPGNSSGCIASSKGYNTGVETLRGEIRGCSVGIAGGIGQVYGRFTETIFQNATNFQFDPDWPPVTMTRIFHETLPGVPAAFWRVPAVPEWSGSGPFPGETRLWTEFDGQTAKVVDWQKTGKHYRFVYPSQKRSAIPWRQSQWYDWMLPPPECGTTLGDVWDRCGMGLNGQPFTPGQEVALQGLVNMVAVEESAMAALGPPRCILTSPNGYFPAAPRPDYGIVVLSFSLTGNNALTSADQSCGFQIVIDGVPQREWVTDAHQPNMALARGVEPMTPGKRVVRTWRLLKGKPLTASTMNFTYCLETACDGPPPPPPPPPPPDPCTTHPLVLNVSITSVGHMLTLAGSLVATDERGCTATVSP